MWLRSGVAVGVGQAGGHSYDGTPGLGTSMGGRCGPKKTKKKKDASSSQILLGGYVLGAPTSILLHLSFHFLDNQSHRSPFHESLWSWVPLIHVEEQRLAVSAFPWQQDGMMGLSRNIRRSGKGKEEGGQRE